MQPIIKLADFKLSSTKKSTYLLTHLVHKVVFVQLLLTVVSLSGVVRQCYTYHSLNELENLKRKYKQYKPCRQVTN